MGHSQSHSGYRLNYGFIAAILLTLGLDTALVLAIYLLVSRIFW